MQLASLNLNHLVALDALFAERHVGRAAARMGVTQSAMSHTLRSLRELMSDPLLVRVGNAMVLTPAAEEAQVKLSRGLRDLESVVSVEVWGPLDLDVTAIWDRIESPPADSAGVTPQRNDLRMTVGLGLDF